MPKMDPRAAGLQPHQAESEEAKPAKEMRRHLPQVPLLSTRQLFSSEGKDYSCFALSPMAAHTLTQLQPGDWTPVTAIHLNDRLIPAIASPTAGPGMSLLDRYLAENHVPPSAIDTPLRSPMTMTKAGLSDTLPTPRLWANWGTVMGSPPESSTECFSPILGEGPAEMEHAFEDRTYEPPTDNESEADTENTFIEEGYGSNCVSNRASRVFDIPPPKKVFPRRNSFPRFETKNKSKTTILITYPPPGSTSAPKSAPLDIKGAVTQPTTPAFHKNDFQKEDIMIMMAPPPAPTADTFTDKLPQVKLTFARSPFDPPPAPTSGSFSDVLPTPIATIERSVFDPPPAPTLARFPEDFPASPIHAGPAPIDTSLPFSPWRKTDEPRTAMASPIIPGQHFQSIMEAMAPPPPPAPTQPNFGLNFPASPIHSKPAPIDTTRSHDDEKAKGKALDEAETPGPGAEPPAPTQEKFIFKTAKMVRFAVSPLPSAHFKIPVSPISPSPRFQSFPRHVRTSSADKTKSDARASRRDDGIGASADRDESPMTDRSVPSTPSSFSSRGRSPMRTGSYRREAPLLWRTTRSQSPKRSVKMLEEEEQETIPILPNTVYNPSTNKVYTTKGQVNSDKYIILQTYFKKNTGADGQVTDPNDGLGGIGMSPVKRTTPEKLQLEQRSAEETVVLSPEQTKARPQVCASDDILNLQQAAGSPPPKVSLTQLKTSTPVPATQPTQHPADATPHPARDTTSFPPKSAPQPQQSEAVHTPHQVNGILASGIVHPLFSNPPQADDMMSTVPKTVVATKRAPVQQSPSS